MYRILSLIALTFCLNAHAQNIDYQWAISADDAYPEAVTVDNSGNSFVAGFYSGSATFGGITLTTTSVAEMFIVKYNAAGTVLWAQGIVGAYQDFPQSIITDSSGNFIITGSFQSTNLTFGSVVLTNTNSPGYETFFIAKFDNNGNPLWAKTVVSGDWEEGTNVVTDANDNIYVSGWFAGQNLDLGGTVLTNFSAGSSDLFLIKYDPLGNLLWAKSAGGDDWETTYGLSIDPSNNVYISGNHGSSLFVFGPDTLLANNSVKTFLLKYDLNGNEIWAREAGGSGGVNSDNNGEAVVSDQVGNIYMCGYFYESDITFGNYTLLNNGSVGTYDLFLAKYDSSGNVIWAKSAGGGLHDKGSALAWDGFGGLYLTGYFESPTISFDAHALTNPSAISGFVVKFDPNGNVRWVESPLGISKNQGTSIYAKSDGSIYHTGEFNTAPVTFGSINLNNLGASNMYLVKMSHCAAYFTLVPDTIPQVWYAINHTTGTPPFSYLWSWGDGNSTSGATPSHTYASPGFYNICLSITDASGCTDTYCDSSVYLLRGPQGLPVTVHVIAPVITSVSETEKLTALLYPNPATDLLHVASHDKQIKKIMIRNILGQTIRDLNLSDHKEITLDVSDLKPGIYLIELSTENGKSITSKFIRSEK